MQTECGGDMGEIWIKQKEGENNVSLWKIDEVIWKVGGKSWDWSNKGLEEKKGRQIVLKIDKIIIRVVEERGVIKWNWKEEIY